MAVVEQVSTNRGARRISLTVVVVQAWLLLSYCFSGPLAYGLRGTRFEELVHDPGTISIVLALAFGVTGFWLGAFGTAAGAGLALLGLITWIFCRRAVSAARNAWLVGLTTASTALVAFSVTPLGRAIEVWVLD